MYLCFVKKVKCIICDSEIINNKGIPIKLLKYCEICLSELSFTEIEKMPKYNFN